MSAHYPPDLADLVLQRWPSDIPLSVDRSTLEHALAVCFQASMLSEEGRGTRFRLVLTPATDLPTDGQPNRGAWRVRFNQPRSLTAEELRRLSPAAPFERTLIGAAPDGETVRIWGLAHTGASWLAPSVGGRRSQIRPWTQAPIIHVTAPGRLAVRTSGHLVAGLERGELVTNAIDVFDSTWLPALFAVTRNEMRKDHGAIEDSLLHVVAQHMVRRAISLIRAQHHGGLILFVGNDYADSMRTGNAGVRLKYQFMDEEPRHRYQSLVAALMRQAEHLGRSGSGRVGWSQLERSDDAAIAAIESSIFELSNLVASLAAVDGAVLLDKRFSLVGFGAEVSAELPSPTHVWRALDREGSDRNCDAAESVGTRHRAAYRFVQQHADALAIVVSHDGAVRFVAQREGAVTFWEQIVGP